MLVSTHLLPRRSRLGERSRFGRSASRRSSCHRSEGRRRGYRRSALRPGFAVHRLPHLVQGSKRARRDRPTRVVSDVSDHRFERRSRDSQVSCDAEVRALLLVTRERDEDAARDHRPLGQREIRPLPDVAEQVLVGVATEVRRPGHVATAGITQNTPISCRPLSPFESATSRRSSDLIGSRQVCHRGPASAK